jgi:hypothetical protein
VNDFVNDLTAPLLELENWSIPQIIARLYEDADVPFPTAARPVTPLRRLILGQGLNQTELPALSSRAAMDYLLRNGGLRQSLPDATRESLAGFLYANSGGGCLFVRREDPVSRRRFSAAHELGHYVLHFPRVLADAQRRGWDEVELIEVLPPAANPDSEEASNGVLRLMDSNGAALPSLDEMEHEADAFAAELLMPAEVVRALAAPFIPHCSDVDLARRLSTEMLVSRAAMFVRLRHLGMLRGEKATLN